MRPAEMTDDVSGAWLDRADPPCAITLTVGLAPEAARRGAVVALPHANLSPLFNLVAALRRPSIEVSAETYGRLVAAEVAGDQATLLRAFACIRAQRPEERVPGDATALTREEVALALACAAPDAPWPQVLLDPEEVASLEEYLTALGPVPVAPPMPDPPDGAPLPPAESFDTEADHVS